MAETPQHENNQTPESLIAPGFDPNTITWLIVLGIPALLVFLILERQQPFQ